jgi:hypothetical protein
MITFRIAFLAIGLMSLILIALGLATVFIKGDENNGVVYLGWGIILLAPIIYYLFSRRRPSK